MPSVTATEIAEDSFALLNVYLPGEAMPPADGAYALRVINRMLSQWSQRALMIPVIAREVFDLTADKGGPSNPYTIGSSANLNTTKPPNQNSIVFASLLLTASDPDVEVPLGIFTDESYAAVKQKELTSAQPTGLYYNPTYATTDFGTINLWPVPDNATNDLVLYMQKALAQFAAVGTTYYVPDGVPEMLVYNVAKRLAGPYGKTMSRQDALFAVESLGVFKRSNTKLSDLANDANWSVNSRTFFNIFTGQGG